ncbi:MAG: ankyrin repeat domain-containing protein [Candidatus Margulisiibacteriota bacterium]
MTRIGDAIPTVRSQTGGKGRTNEQVIVGSSAAVNTLESQGENPERIRTKAATNIQRRIRGTISRLKLDTIKKHGFICPIKQDTIDVHESTLTDCGHIFDRQSLKTWIEKEMVSKSSVDCPSCRKDIVSVMAIDSQLLLFARYGKANDILNVLRRGVNLEVKDNEGRTAVNIAATRGHLHTLRFLVNELGADMNVTDKYGSKVLHRAAGHGHLNILEFLKEHVEDVNATDVYGNTALHLAAANGHLHTLRFLVYEFGADMNATDKWGNTALHLAAGNGNLNVVKFLVNDLGADVNARNEEGHTALHLAVAQEHTDIVRLLVNDLGADVNARNEEGHTALQFATLVDTNTLRVLEELSPRN